jgi:hypothetical protein
MTTDSFRPKDDEANAAVLAILPYSVRQRIFLYLGALIVLLSCGAPAGGLIDIPITFLLKNKLHLKAHELANFRVISAIPLYLSGVFRLYPRYLESLWDEGPWVHAIVRRGNGRTLRGFCLHPPYIWHTSPRDVALDELVFVCRERTERTDIDTRPATCDVGLNQRDLEHLSVDPYGRGVAPRRHAERCT